MSWWKSKNTQQDSGESPAERYNKISQPVTEMIRRIDADEDISLSEVAGGGGTLWYIDFLGTSEQPAQIIVSWYHSDPESMYDTVMHQEWMTKVEVSAIVRATQRCVIKTEASRKISEREEWCKRLGVNQ